MSYIDALFDREHDRIHVVERVDGKRCYQEYPANYIFYYEDARGKFQSIFGTPVSRFSSRNNKEFRKELRIQSGKKLFESDINPVFRCLEDNYKGQDGPKLNVAFFDIEVDFDPDRGFSRPEDPFNPITAITVYMDWLDHKYIGIVSSRLEKFKRKGSNLYNFRCPICGDSENNQNKARGYIYQKEGKMMFHCHNCNASLSVPNFIKTVDQTLYNEMMMEKLKADGRLLAHAAADLSQFPAEAHDKDKTYFGSKLITTGIVYNTKAAMKPTSWTDLVKPEAKNQLAMPSPLNSGAASPILRALLYLPARVTVASPQSARAANRSER